MIRTGRDLAIATLLGAEEWGVATAALIAEGCIMMRKCHLNTCPVGIATQNPELRKLFTGKPEHVIQMFTFMAEELREIMAELGFRTVDAMVGQAHVLKVDTGAGHWKAQRLDLDGLLADAGWTKGTPEAPTQPIPTTPLDRTMVAAVEEHLATGGVVAVRALVKNTDRAIGAEASHVLTKARGAEGLAEDSVIYRLEGSAGQSFAAFAARGLTFHLTGESNDYTGKGLSGAKVIIQTPPESDAVAHRNIACGNVALYGATSGELYVNGVAGERFAVRNSGATAVVEGVGDHGCEYMTGGKVIVLGKTGKNFGAGMSGGIAYVYDEDGTFASRFNADSADLDPLDTEDQEWLTAMLRRHIELTASQRAEDILSSWQLAAQRFIKVFPREYKRIVQSQNVKIHG